MKESHGKGLASHTGPESCGDVREGGAEALTGERAGRVLSREIDEPHSGVPTLSNKRKATPVPSPSRDEQGPRAVRDPAHARKHHAREPGDPAFVCGDGPADRIGKSKDTRR